MTDHKFDFIIGTKFDDAFQSGEYIIPLDEWTISHHHTHLRQTVSHRSLRHYLIRSRSDMDRLAEENIPHDLIWASWIQGKCITYDKLCIMVTDYVLLDPADDKSHLMVPVIRDPEKGRIIKAESLLKDQLITENVAVVLVINSDFYMERSVKEGRFPEYCDPVRLDSHHVLFYPSYLSPKPRYRLYLNDRMMIERVYEIDLDHSDQCYNENMIFNRVPAEGFNFRLESELNITLLAVDILEQRTVIGQDTFSYTPDK